MAEIQLAGSSVIDNNSGTRTVKNVTLDSTVSGGSGITALGTVASGTLGSNVIFPDKVRDLTCWYPSVHQNGTWTSIDAYPTHDIANVNGRFHGVVPKGFTSLISAEYIVFNTSSVTATLAMHYNISRNGAAFNEHEGGLTNIPTAVSKSFTANQMEYLNLLDGSHSPKFEDTIAEGDIFAIRINCSNNGSMYAMGAKFVWRF